jgi:hypothetical protein
VAVATVIVGALLTVAVVATPAMGWLTASSSSGGTATVAPASGLAVVGTVGAEGLYPGKAAQALVRVTNTGASPSAVTGISVDPAGAVGGCPAGTVTATSRLDAAGLLQTDGSTRVVAPGGAVATYAVDVTMAADAPAACIGASFVLAVQVHGASA